MSAIELFGAFIKGSNHVFLLKGAAGTGKTTLVLEFIRLLQKQKCEVRLMAPTGRAAHILGGKTGIRLLQFTGLSMHWQVWSLQGKNKETEDDGGLHAKFG